MPRSRKRARRDGNGPAPDLKPRSQATAQGPDEAQAPVQDRQNRRRRSARRLVAQLPSLTPRLVQWIELNIVLVPCVESAASLPGGAGQRESQTMSAAIETLLQILNLETLDLNIFRGRSPQAGWQRVFGGHVIGQALVAACRTVDVLTRPPHSMHAYFLLAGDPKAPIIYEVERVRDGKSFTTRRVKAIQHGEAIFISSVSFHGEEHGMSHQAHMPDVPTPDELPSEAEIKERILPLMPEPARRYFERERPIELR